MLEMPEICDPHVNVGGSRSVAPGRISYNLDLRGPSVSVDTACSSSLVALHLAVQSLRTGESPVALAAGVNILLRPEAYVGFSLGGMLSPDGRCKAFDERGDGFVRSEGVGVVVLMPLDRALAEGRRVYAVVRGTAVNNDGASSGYLMTPGKGGQADLLRRARADAGAGPPSSRRASTWPGSSAHGPARWSSPPVPPKRSPWRCGARPNVATTR